MEATVHQPKTPFCLHCNCCLLSFWQTEQLSHFLNPTFFLIVCFKNWCHSTKRKLKFYFNTVGDKTQIWSNHDCPLALPNRKAQGCRTWGLQQRQLRMCKVFTPGCFSTSVLRGTAWWGFLCCSFMTGSQTVGTCLQCLLACCFIQLLFH